MVVTRRAGRSLRVLWIVAGLLMVTGAGHRMLAAPDAEGEAPSSAGTDGAYATGATPGFTNSSSIAIQIGGIAGIAPNGRHDLSRLGLRAMIAGSLAAFMTAAIAGMLL